MQPKTRNLPTDRLQARSRATRFCGSRQMEVQALPPGSLLANIANIANIASTACVPSQAPFPQVSFKWKLEKTGLHGAYPPDPLSAPKLSNYSNGITEFIHVKTNPTDTAQYKNLLYQKEGKGQNNG